MIAVLLGAIGLLGGLGWVRARRWRTRRGELDSFLSPTRGPTLSRRVVVTAVLAALLGGTGLIGAAPATAAELGLPVVDFGDCKTPPMPDRPDTLTSATFDSPDPNKGTGGSPYNTFGYAGMTWSVYDLGCGGDTIREPTAVTDTWLGNQFLGLASVIVSFANGFHYWMQDGSANPVTRTVDQRVVGTGTEATWQAVFLPWVGVALTIAAVSMLWMAGRGETSEIAKKGGYVLAALATAGLALAPNPILSASDQLMATGTNQLAQGFLTRTGVGDQNTLPTKLYDVVLYQNWLRGEFGRTDAPQVAALAGKLQHAQAFTKQDVTAGNTNTDARQTEFHDLVTAQNFGDSYLYVQGKAHNRSGAGLLALVEALSIALFQVMTLVAIMAGMLIVRIALVLLPALAVLAVIRNDVLPRALRVVGTAFGNAFLLALVAGVHTWLVVTLLGQFSVAGLFIVILATALLWYLASPIRRTKQMIVQTGEAVGVKHHRGGHHRPKVNVNIKRDDPAGGQSPFTPTSPHGYPPQPPPGRAAPDESAAHRPAERGQYALAAAGGGQAGPRRGGQAGPEPGGDQPAAPTVRATAERMDRPGPGSGAGQRSRSDQHRPRPLPPSQPAKIWRPDGDSPSGDSGGDSSGGAPPSSPPPAPPPPPGGASS